jgi:hypothetical protein
VGLGVAVKPADPAGTTKVAGHHRAPLHAHRVYGAPWPAVPIITGLYRYYPGGTPDPDAPPDNCITTGNNCTTVELCERWGEC